MTEELDILKILEHNSSISQRKISEQTGISLGQVNFLIKKCVKKGLIKMEGQSSKSLKYNLTPKGLAEKASLTLEYVKISYGAVMVLTDKIRALAQDVVGEGKTVYLHGSNDEMMEIVKLALNTGHIPWKPWQEETNLRKGRQIGKEEVKEVVLFWEADKKEQLENFCIEAINILE